MKPHFFSRELAREVGVHGAIVLRFLSYKTRRSKNRRNGKSWFFDSLENLQKRFPYISKSTLGDTIKNLSESDKVLQKDRFNRRGYDRTGWYHVPSETCEKAERDLIAFDVEVAKESGVCAGVLIHNLRYNSRKEGSAELSPAKLHKRLPFFSTSTIKRAIKKLVQTGKIERVEATSRFRIVKQEEIALNEPRPNPDIDGSNSEMPGPNPDDEGSNPDENGSNLDDDTHYETIKKPINENPIKKAIQTLPGEFVCTEKEGVQINPIKDPEIPEGVDGELYSLLTSKDGLLKICQDNKGIINSFLLQSDENRWKAFCWQIKCALEHYIATESAENLMAAVQESQPAMSKNLVSRWIPLFQDVFKKLAKNGFEANAALLKLGAEMLSAAFARRTRAFNSDQNFNRNLEGSWDLSCSIGKKIGLYQLQLQEEDYRRYAAENPSIDADKEDDATLTASEKARVFRNAINAYNDIGVFYTGTQFKCDPILFQDLLVFSRESFVATEHFFSRNPSMTVTDLMDVAKACGLSKIRMKRGELETNEVFWAEKGHNITFMITNLRKILEELNLNNLPKWCDASYPTRDELFPNAQSQREGKNDEEMKD